MEEDYPRTQGMGGREKRRKRRKTMKGEELDGRGGGQGKTRRSMEEEERDVMLQWLHRRDQAIHCR